MRLTIPGLALLALTLPGAARAADWPGWRGPRGDGTCDRALPLKWGPTDNVAWKTPIPGKGHSSPVVSGDRVFLTTCLEQEAKKPGDPAPRLLLCLDRRGGSVLWRKEVISAPLEKLHRLNSRASSTPATDGKHVFVTFLDPSDLKDQRVIVGCYDFEGNRVWQLSPGRFSSVHGFCSSPLLYKDTLIVNCDHDGDGYVVCLAKSNGLQRWRIDRPNKTRSYCAPLIVDAEGKAQMVMSGSKCVASYDPDTGKQWWMFDGPTEQFVSSPVYLDGLFFLTAGFPTYHYMGIRPDGEVAWHHKVKNAREGAYVPSPIAFDRWFYAVSDDGILNCFEAKGGEWLWKKQLGKHHSASPVLAGGYLYFTADSGDTYVLKAGESFELVGVNALGEDVYASPAAADGQMFLRGDKHLFCIGK
ncbi:MAG TPA: PQQ-binding-like beta-propeller repeat protein [Gemmataceae bacterium]|nr:PQQ-binding-like beta-propeller repeat protein [Gemmataceae bacterium]